MKKTIRTIGILLVIISIIFAFVNIGLLRFNYFKLLSNGTAQIMNDSYNKNEIQRININLSNEFVQYVESEDSKVHFSYINSDKFYFDIEVEESGDVIDVNLTDNLMWYDYFTFYRRIPIQIAIPKGVNIEVFENGVKLDNINYSEYIQEEFNL